MWKKVFSSPVAYFTFGLAMGVILLSLYGRQNIRYVSSFSRSVIIPQIQPSPDTPKTKQALQLLQNMVPLVQKYPWFKNLDEYLLIKVTDADNSPFSVRIKNGEVTIKPGWDNSQKPTLAVEKVYTIHLKRLNQILADGEIEDQEKFEIASVFLVPGLQALYNSDVLYFPGDKRFLKLDNFIQVELTNSFNAKDSDGVPIEAKATVINADGYWLVFPGWQGQSDVRYTVDVDQLIHYYYLINYKFKELKPQDLLGRSAILDEYMKLRQETLSYSKYK